MMKPAATVVLATLAFVGCACTAGPPAHASKPDAASVTSAGPSQPAGPAGRAAQKGQPRSAAAPATLLLGHLVMRAPASWRVTYSDAKGDYTVSTGNCRDDALLGSMGGARCPSFSMIVGAGGAAGPVPTVQTYSRGRPYNPSAGILGCPGKPAAQWQRLGPRNAYHESFAHITRSGTAYYTVWRIGCGPAGPAGPAAASFYFEQRDWYLPVSRILVVDEYSIPGLAAVLAAATWR
jgi:hypothetical protein